MGDGGRANNEIVENGDSEDSGQDGAEASRKKFRLTARSEVTNFDEKQLSIHLQSFWKNQVEHQLQNFVLRFFNFFVSFVKEDLDFVQIMKNLSKLYGNLEWNGVIIIRGEGVEAAVYYEKIEFRVSGDKFSVEIGLDDIDNLEGAGFVQKVDSLVDFLTEHVSTHSQAVEVFPDSADEIKSHICGFNPV